MKTNVRLRPMDLRLHELKLVASAAGLTGEITYQLGALVVRIPVPPGACEPLEGLDSALEDWVLQRIPMFEPQGSLGPDTGLHQFPQASVLIQDEEEAAE